MAKLIIVVALCMLAVASAMSLESLSMNKFTSEARTCPEYTCLTSGADCVSTSTNYKICPAAEYYNETYSSTGATESCNCALPSAWLAIGAVCTSYSDNKCGPLASCALKMGSDVYHCTGYQMIGDSCTTTNDCAGERICTSGKCVATLAAGAACYNATTYKTLGQCPLGQYCPQAITMGVNPMCSAWLGAGGACTSALGTTQGCPPYMRCVAGACARYPIQTIDNGAAPATGFGEMTVLQCKSLLMNTTDGKCIDYDATLAAWKVMFPTPASVACTIDDDCNIHGARIARCQCTTAKTGATPYCQLMVAPSLDNAADIALFKTNGIVETGSATCENSRPASFQGVVDSSKYCFSAWRSQFLAAACPAFTASTPGGYQCYDESFGICNGASALKSSVLVTMIVALVAFFTTQ